jgi:hypothetical protein
MNVLSRDQSPAGEARYLQVVAELEELSKQQEAANA